MRTLEGAVCGETDDAEQVVAQVQNRKWKLVILDCPPWWVGPYSAKSHHKCKSKPCG